MDKPAINIVWFKRDLRFTDHEPLYYAQQQKLPLLLVYFFEPSLMAHDDSAYRHWRFVYESLLEMQTKLKSIHAQIYIFHSEVLPVFEELSKQYKITSVFSHQEIGNNLSYQRDIAISGYFKMQAVSWNEYQLHGVIRKLKSKNGWEQRWHEKMKEVPKFVNETNWNLLVLDPSLYSGIKGKELPKEIITPDKNFQPGGETYAWRYMESFIKTRYINYSKHISKPGLSRKSCSRLSPYLAYGNISMRMVYQYTLQHYEKSANKRDLDNFISRLHWHCYFMQRFESHSFMEFENLNSACDELQKPKNEFYIRAWQSGKTGVPIIDACMRCVAATGYINFRMRAMVVSFFVFNLWQDWRELHFLARQFLDYEPGIHYPQLQMQAGTAPFDTIRVYNPVKNSQEHDPEGLFIKQWLPELKNIPREFVHEPWKMTTEEQKLFLCELGKDYPEPIIGLEETRKYASDKMWKFKRQPLNVS
ncbi:deoxyribodipyrimidine photolyase [Sphingobacteriaceae bacterium]|nr:deoxyribodipyrimidine photolyase [Sphingobacteriaceae bacterium]